MPAPQFGAALSWVIANLGGPVTENLTTPSSSNLGANQIIGGNGDRVGLLIVNCGTDDLFINITPAVSTTNGIRLAAGGGAVSFNLKDDFTLMSRAWFGVTANAITQITIIELSRFAKIEGGGGQ